MLRAGHSLRFTPTEIEEFRRLGLDVDGTRTLAGERPELLDKIAFAMAKAKGTSLPARLTRVR